MRIAQEEIFGPVLTVIPFDTEAEAIRIANGTNYGLASVHTATLRKPREWRTRCRQEPGSIATTFMMFLCHWRLQSIWFQRGKEVMENYTHTKSI